MEEDKFEKLITEIRQSRSDVEQKLASTVADLKREVTSAQERTSNDFSKKMASLTYQFKKKSHEHQFHFNAELQGAFASVKTELDRLDPATPQDQSTILRARNQLDEGLKALATRQKFIKIADRSELLSNTTRAILSPLIQRMRRTWEGLRKRQGKMLRGNQPSVAVVSSQP